MYKTLRYTDNAITHIFGVMLAAMMLPSVAVSSVEENHAQATQQKSTVAEAVNKKGDSPFGIQVLSIRRTAADYMLEFRYRILDAEKAAYLMDRKIKPELLVEKSGHRFQVPVTQKIGPLRQSPKFAKVDKNYFMFFANPGRAIKAGDKVTVEIGDFKAEHLVVE